MTACVSTVNELQPFVNVRVLRKQMVQEQELALKQGAVPLVENSGTRSDGLQSGAVPRKRAHLPRENHPGKEAENESTQEAGSCPASDTEREEGEGQELSWGPPVTSSTSNNDTAKTCL